MKLIGSRVVKETTSQIGRKYYLDQYQMTPEEYIERYELDVFTKEVESIKAFVHLEYDGTIEHAVLLEEGDKAHVWGQGCYGQPFNTDGQAFLEVAPKDGVTIRQFCYDNSPYQLIEDNDEWFDMSLNYETLGEIRSWFVEEVNKLFDTELSFDEIIFIRML